MVHGRPSKACTCGVPGFSRKNRLIDDICIWGRASGLNEYEWRGRCPTSSCGLVTTGELIIQPQLTRFTPLIRFLRGEEAVGGWEGAGRTQESWGVTEKSALIGGGGG